MRYILVLISVITGVFIFSGCSEAQRERLAPVRVAFGELNQVVVVADDVLLETAIGDSIQYIFAGPYPLLPQPEPVLDLRFYSPNEFNAAAGRREFRNILIFAVLDDETSVATAMVKRELNQETLDAVRNEKKYTTIVKKDVWAKPQQVIYIVGKSSDDLLEAVRQQSPAIMTRLRSQEAELLNKRVYGGGVAASVEKQIIDAFDIKIKVPAGFITAIYDKEEKFLWMKRQATRGLWNIMVHELDYKSRDQLTAEGLKQIRNQLGKQFIQSELPNTYMQINDRDLPVITTSYSKKGNYVVESRGIWEIENDFMGGPFISYLYYNPDAEKLIFVDAFVFAPNEEKRDMMQTLDHVLNSVQFGPLN